MRQSQILSSLSLCVVLLHLAACGGGPGGQLSPDQNIRSNQPQAQKRNDPYAPKPKPKINRDAKQLFVLAGQIASRANPDYNRALDLY